MELVSEKLEQNLRLLGATAIEDRLQDGVPEAIANLKRAGLKIWVATGDKLETAIGPSFYPRTSASESSPLRFTAIGKTCNLLSRDMNLIIIKGGAHGEPNSAYSQMRSAMERFMDCGDLVDQLENQPPEYQPAEGRKSGSSFRRPALNRAATGVSGITDIVGDDNGERPGGYGLVIDGASLRHAFEEPYSKALLLELATRCRAVICCRVSPLQKALIVRLVKDGLGVMTLAIGDGANDVSMIQAADIGIGVAGEEGLQAVNSSDYAIAQFRFLQRLLLVHGHFSYMRNSNMIVNFFVRPLRSLCSELSADRPSLDSTRRSLALESCSGSSSTAPTRPRPCTSTRTCSSGTSSGPSVSRSPFAMDPPLTPTGLVVPVIAIGVFDRNISDNVLMNVPELYEVGRLGRLFGIRRFCVYMLVRSAVLIPS